MTAEREPGSSSRRDFLAQASALGALSLIGGQAAAQTARRGGRLVLAAPGGGAGDSLDPRTFSSVYHGNIAYAYGNCLTEIVENNRVAPELAESWEYQDGGKRWLFELRRGVVFHNGKAMTSADVVWSLNLHRAADTKSGAKALMTPIVDIRADGPARIVIELSAPYVDLPQVLSDWHLLIIPAGTTDFNAGIGTGPFSVKRFVPGQTVEMVRNPNYWKANRGWFNEVEMLAVNDASARINGLVTGEIHLVERIDTKTVAMLERNNQIRIHKTVTGGYRPFAMHCDTAPFDNPDLRRALQLAIDREDYVKRVFSGFGRIGNDHPIAPVDPMFSAAIPQRRYDPDQARSLYRKSGHSGPIPLHVSEAPYSEAIDAATVFKEHAAKAGIDIQIVREPAAGYWSNVWLKKPFCVSSWGARPTAEIALATAFKSDAPFNETRWKNPEFDRLLAQARSEFNDGRRKEIYHRCQLMIHETGGSINPIFNDFVDGSRANLAGWIPGNHGLSGMRAAERMWFAS